MRNSQPYSAGLGTGINWELLGICHVTLGEYGPTQIEVVKPPITVKTTPASPSTALKPYQNPTGVWMQGIWETDAKRSAIFATKTW